MFEGEGNEVQSFNKELFIQELNNITQQKVIEDANEAYLVMPAGTIGFNNKELIIMRQLMLVNIIHSFIIIKVQIVQILYHK